MRWIQQPGLPKQWTYLSDYVRPICLLVEGHMAESPIFNITGWGVTDNGTPSRRLQKATVYNTDLHFCRSKFTKQVDESQICAAGTNSDACHGDSGGPLSAQVPFAGSWLTFQYGLVSYGSAACHSFSVYTNVTHHRDWIVSAIEDFSRAFQLRL